jgi:hypothetical protein
MKPAHEIIGPNGRPLIEPVPVVAPPHSGPDLSGPREPTAHERLFFGADCAINPQTSRPVGELRPPTDDERKVFGHDCFISPNTDRPVEAGSGALIHRVPGGRDCAPPFQTATKA